LAQKVVDSLQSYNRTKGRIPVTVK
jgi:hypothetical protein